MSKLLSYKVFFWVILVIAILEGFLIYSSSKLENIIELPMYSFYDSKKDLVTAQGAWVSTTDLAFPLSTSNIQCWKDFGYCWISTSTIFDFGTGGPMLSGDLDLKEIAYWNDDFIETKPSKPLAGCVEETYRLDRRSQTVTYTRKTVDNTSEICKDIQKDPIISTLEDGFKRLEINKNNK